MKIINIAEESLNSGIEDILVFTLTDSGYVGLSFLNKNFIDLSEDEKNFLILAQIMINNPILYSKVPRQLDRNHFLNFLKLDDLLNPSNIRGVKDNQKKSVRLFKNSEVPMDDKNILNDLGNISKILDNSFDKDLLLELDSFRCSRFPNLDKDFNLHPNIDKNFNEDFDDYFNFSKTRNFFNAVKNFIPLYSSNGSDMHKIFSLKEKDLFLTNHKLQNIKSSTYDNIYKMENSLGIGKIMQELLFWDDIKNSTDSLSVKEKKIKYENNENILSIFSGNSTILNYMPKIYKLLEKSSWFVRSFLQDYSDHPKNTFDLLKKPQYNRNYLESFDLKFQQFLKKHSVIVMTVPLRNTKKFLDSTLSIYNNTFKKLQKCVSIDLSDDTKNSFIIHQGEDKRNYRDSFSYIYTIQGKSYKTIKGLGYFKHIKRDDMDYDRYSCSYSHFYSLKTDLFRINPLELSLIKGFNFDIFKHLTYLRNNIAKSPHSSYLHPIQLYPQLNIVSRNFYFLGGKPFSDLMSKLILPYSLTNDMVCFSLEKNFSFASILNDYLTVFNKGISFSELVKRYSRIKCNKESMSDGYLLSSNFFDLNNRNHEEKLSSLKFNHFLLQYFGNYQSYILKKINWKELEKNEEFFHKKNFCKELENKYFTKHTLAIIYDMSYFYYRKFFHFERVKKLGYKKIINRIRLNSKQIDLSDTLVRASPILSLKSIIFEKAFSQSFELQKNHNDKIRLQICRNITSNSKDMIVKNITEMNSVKNILTNLEKQTNVMDKFENDFIKTSNFIV